MAVRRRVVVAGLLGNAMTAVAMASPLLTTQDASSPLRSPPPMSPASPLLPPTVPAYPASAALPPWRRYAMAAAQSEGRPVISVVIDDLGVMQAARAFERALPWADKRPKLD